MIFDKKIMKSPIEYFSSITDPRTERTKEHLLSGTHQSPGIRLR